MSIVGNTIADLVGRNTARQIEPYGESGKSADIYLKLEYFNPGF